MSWVKVEQTRIPSHTIATPANKYPERARPTGDYPHNNVMYKCRVIWIHISTQRTD